MTGRVALVWLRLYLFPLMVQMSLDEVINAWWMAKCERAKRIEKKMQRAADPDNMFGKSPEYVAAYFAKKREERS